MGTCGSPGREKRWPMRAWIRPSLPFCSSCPQLTAWCPGTMVRLFSRQSTNSKANLPQIPLHTHTGSSQSFCLLKCQTTRVPLSEDTIQVPFLSTNGEQSMPYWPSRYSQSVKEIPKISPHRNSGQWLFGIFFFKSYMFGLIGNKLTHPIPLPNATLTGSAGSRNSSSHYIRFKGHCIIIKLSSLYALGREGGRETGKEWGRYICVYTDNRFHSNSSAPLNTSPI